MVPLARRMGKRAGRLARPSSAILRASYTTWGARAPSLQPQVSACRELAAEARSGKVKPGDWLPKHRRQRWRELYCDEYAAVAGDALPDLGYTLPALAPTASAQCPPASVEFVLITYQNGPSSWLCTFLRTLAYRRVPITVLGWQPYDFSRNNNVFYFTDRVYTTLRYLESCPQLSPNATVMFCDADEMLQLGLETLLRRTQELYLSTKASVVISAEARCMPEKLGKLAWAHSEAIAHMHKKWPRCLNTGNFVGRVGAVIDMLRQICRPCRDGLPIEQVFRRYTRAYSAQVSDWIYSEQAELMRLHLARPSNVSGWVLDFQQRLFHPNFWFNTQADTRVLRDGRIRNFHTGSVPGFIHYNGNSKTAWVGRHSPSSLSAALRRGYIKRSGDTTLEMLNGFINEHISFIGPTFQRDRNVRFADVCSKGEV